MSGAGFRYVADAREYLLPLGRRELDAVALEQARPTWTFRSPRAADLEAPMMAIITWEGRPNVTPCWRRPLGRFRSSIARDRWESVASELEW